MRRSELERAISDEFGARAESLTVDLVLSSLGERTVAQAMDAGIAPREIWLALCAATDVPEDRRYGVGRLESKRR
ncbi:DUF3046 domain-containing protein [Microbacterium pygmaeum]|uniref:Signal transduction histidine kinase n=1 Tax=Microbacterium pygmaeum TaxID=370764 RepID=A0A1G8BVC2_9MICO|nr:DUF3046 domain-containing protein [Microbacterium pygmaeum]SDH37167.1 Protein of unknown function [Microbacterium pygmaeum]